MRFGWPIALFLAVILTAWVGFVQSVTPGIAMTFKVAMVVTLLAFFHSVWYALKEPTSEPE